MSNLAFKNMILMITTLMEHIWNQLTMQVVSQPYIGGGALEQKLKTEAKTGGAQTLYASKPHAPTFRK